MKQYLTHGAITLHAPATDAIDSSNVNSGAERLDGGFMDGFA